MVVYKMQETDYDTEEANMNQCKKCRWFIGKFEGTQNAMACKFHRSKIGLVMCEYYESKEEEDD